jgi:dTDP-4-amino-4,6-dideoxy-D-galactose acyltransferase
MSEGVRYLDWDSQFFGFKVGASNKFPNCVELSELLKKDKYRLIYFQIDPNDGKSANEADKQGALLVDTKILYELDLRNGVTPFTTYLPEITVDELEDSNPDSNLYELAFQSGEYSRFRTDQNFPPQSFTKLYRQWIDRSLNREIASHVIVARFGEQFVGFSTLNIVGSTAKIGLFSVDKRFRNKKIGKAIISYIIQLLDSKLITSLEVTTQNQNRIACLFYESCGFTKRKTVWVYHLWLNV